MISETVIPPHVLANQKLSDELEAAYYRRVDGYREMPVHSTTARIRFKDGDSRARFFERLAVARNAGADIVLPPLDYCGRCYNKGTVIGWRGNVVPCPISNCQARIPVLQRFAEQRDTDECLGLVAVGQSQVLPGRGARHGTGSADHGVLHQT